MKPSRIESRENKCYFLHINAKSYSMRSQSVKSETVRTFEKQSPGAPIHTSSCVKVSRHTIIPANNQTELTATLGDHITIDIDVSKYPNDKIIMTHKIFYVSEKLSPKI